MIPDICPNCGYLIKPNAEAKWPPDFSFVEWWTERDRKHPIPGMPQLAQSYAMSSVYRDFTPQEFDVVHDAWCEYWKTQNGGIPKLAVFLQDRWYRKMPPVRNLPKSKQQLSVDQWDQI